MFEKENITQQKVCLFSLNQTQSSKRETSTPALVWNRWRNCKTKKETKIHAFFRFRELQGFPWGVLTQSYEGSFQMFIQNNFAR